MGIVPWSVLKQGDATIQSLRWAKCSLFCIMLAIVFGVAFLVTSTAYLHSWKEAAEPSTAPLFRYLCEKNGYLLETAHHVQLCAEQHFLTVQEDAWCRMQGMEDLDTPEGRKACDTDEFRRQLTLFILSVSNGDLSTSVSVSNADPSSANNDDDDSYKTDIM